MLVHYLVLMLLQYPFLAVLMLVTKESSKNVFLVALFFCSVAQLLNLRLVVTSQGL